MAQAPTKAGRYQIIGEIGRGSMGVVYSGYDPVISRKVAIKTMQTDMLKSSEFAEYKARFQREAQSAGVLAHPNIVTVYDFGEDHGILYLTMEYLEGRPLDKIIEEKPAMPIETVIQIFEQVCGALNYAHSQKIIHRDIKPANIMVVENGLVKVTDFGIAKIMGGAMTQTGGILGTPNYMSPEQVTGKQLDGRSDIFSLGVILYEMVTGVKPFSGENITTVIYKIVNEDPTPPRQLHSAIHPGLAFVIGKALSKTPAERYQTCLELAEDLKHYRNLRTAQPFATVPINVPSSRRADSYAAHPSQPSRPPAIQDAVIAAEPRHEATPSSSPRPMARAAKSSNVTWLLLGILIATATAAGAYYYFEVLPRRAANPTEATIPAPNVARSSPAPAAGPSAGNGAANASPAGNAATPESPAPAGGVSGSQSPASSAASPAVKSSGGSGLCNLTVETDIPGATISLDGKNQSDWITPFTFAHLAPGTHDIMVAKDGFEGSTQKVDLKAGESRDLQLKLSAETGVVDLKTDPPGVEVSIDGKSYGKSPVQITLPAGRHHYELIRHGRTIYTRTFLLKPNGFVATTVPLEGRVHSGGAADIRTIPPGAKVSLDGKTLEELTPLRATLSPGRHILILWEPGYQSVREVIEIVAGETVPVNVILNH